MGTAALSERDYVYLAIDRAGLTFLIGRDTVEKLLFGMIRWEQQADGFTDWRLNFGYPDFIACAASYGSGSRWR